MAEYRALFRQEPSGSLHHHCRDLVQELCRDLLEFNWKQQRAEHGRDARDSYLSFMKIGIHIMNHGTDVNTERGRKTHILETCFLPTGSRSPFMAALFFRALCALLRDYLKAVFLPDACLPDDATSFDNLYFVLSAVEQIVIFYPGAVAMNT
jgi:hypothetical protein